MRDSISLQRMDNIAQPIIAGKPQEGKAGLHDVVNPFNGSIIGKVGYCSKDQLQEAIAIASILHTATFSTPERSKVLAQAASLLKSRSEECAKLITAEAGKPIKFSRIEVERAVFVLEASAKVALTIDENIPVDVMEAANARGKSVTYRYMPAGPVAAITPFNFPLNLVVHKIGPAIAAGCPVLLKPAPQTPLTSFFLAGILTEAGLPEGWLSVLPCENEVAETLVTDDRIKIVSFTGSAAVGWKLKALAPKKKVTLELGGNGAVIVDEAKDWDALIKSLATAAFYYAGQVCISLQRLYVARPLYKELVERLVAAAIETPMGDPFDETVVVGPMISSKEAKKSWTWIEDAIAEGATIHCGKFQEPNWISPTVLTTVSEISNIYKEEAFCPVVLVEPYDNFSAVIDKVNSSKYGLQVGLFSSDLSKISEAYKRLETGGLIINESTSFRVDTMPYGGIKESGFGREGVEFAAHDFCEIKVLVQ